METWESWDSYLLSEHEYGPAESHDCIAGNSDINKNSNDAEFVGKSSGANVEEELERRWTNQDNVVDLQMIFVRMW